MTRPGESSEVKALTTEITVLQSRLGVGNLVDLIIL
jgi:hypothetical protein